MNRKDNDGNTSLHWAAQKGSAELVKEMKVEYEGAYTDKDLL